MFVLVRLGLQPPKNISLACQFEVVFFAMPGVNEGLNRNVGDVFGEREIATDADDVYCVPPGDMLEFRRGVVGPTAGGAVDRFALVATPCLFVSLVVGISGVFYGVD